MIDEDGADLGASGPSAFGGAPTRWAALTSPWSEDRIRERLRRAVADQAPSESPVVLSVSENKRGFLVRFKAGARTLAGEITVKGWADGTQVHVAVPTEENPKQLRLLVDWLEPLLK